MMHKESVMPESTTLTNRPAWQALQEHYNQIRSRHLRAMFAEEPKPIPSIA